MNWLDIHEKVTKLASPARLNEFLTELIKLIAKESKKPFLNLNSKRDGFDLMFPQGILDMPGPLFVEFVTRIQKDAIEKTTDLLLSMLDIADEEKVARGLVIGYQAQSSLTNTAREHIRQKLRGTTTDLICWGQEEIELLTSQYPELTDLAYERVFALTLENVLETQSLDWKKERESVLSNLCSSYQSGRFAIMLGAGVSSSAGLPDWNSLLNSLLVTMVEGEEKVPAATEDVNLILTRLQEIDGPSALLLARYIRKGVTMGKTSSTDKFIESVTRQLYELRNKEYLISSPLIQGIAELCTPTRTGAKVRSIITYNFDDLIERELKLRKLRHKSIYESIEIPKTEELPIYHVHGFLPENRGEYQNLNSSTLVFSEEGYHHIYADAYHWSNLVQLNTLKENTCLFIGLSLTDPNLRRLMEISAKSYDRPRHFALLKRIDLDNFMKTKKGQLKVNKHLVSDFLKRHHNINERVMSELGVTIIWYETYDDIPELLSNICDSM